MEELGPGQARKLEAATTDYVCSPVSIVKWNGCVSQ